MQVLFRFQPFETWVSVARQQLELTLFFAVVTDTDSRRSRRDLVIPLSDDTNYDTFDVVKFLSDRLGDLVDINDAKEIRPKFPDAPLERYEDEETILLWTKLMGLHEELIKPIDRAMVSANMDIEYWEATMIERTRGD